jgi:hypothetical protein
MGLCRGWRKCGDKNTPRGSFALWSISMPKRIRRRRVKGWRLPEGAIIVSRPSLWGNPWTPQEAWPGTPKADRAAWAVSKYREELTHWGLLSDYAYYVSDRRWGEIEEAIHASGAKNMGEYAAVALRGHDLCCWCPLCETHRDGLPLGVDCPDCPPCHADLLLCLANPETTP